MSTQPVLYGLAFIGWLVSFGLFSTWMASNGYDLVGGWVDGATASTFGAGFFTDLLVSGLMVSWLAVSDARRLGGRWVAATLAATWVLGLCVGLAVWWFALQRSRTTAPTDLEA